MICFRYAPDGKTEPELDDLNRGIVEKILKNGFAMVVSTKIRQKVVLRFCTINPRTSKDDIRNTILKLEEFGDEICEQGGEPSP